jgi:hypothetical protein
MQHKPNQATVDPQFTTIDNGVASATEKAKETINKIVEGAKDTFTNQKESLEDLRAAQKDNPRTIPAVVAQDAVKVAGGAVVISLVGVGAVLFGAGSGLLKGGLKVLDKTVDACESLNTWKEAYTPKEDKPKA